MEGIKHLEMKELVRKEYFRRVKKILKSKLNGGNTIKAINSRAVSIIRYGAGIVDWTKEELQEMDRKTRKLLTINRALYPQADVNRLYLKRSEGGRGMIGVEDCVTIETNSLMSYIKQHANKKALKAVAREQVLKVRREGMDKKSLREERREKYLAKPLHGQFFRGTENRDERSWEWLKRGKLKKETELLLFAAQDQALRTNSLKSRIDKQDVSPSCRMCGEREETVGHIVAECKMLAQKYYKNWRHDKVAQVVHWRLCKSYGLESGDIWYKHEPKPVTENEQTKILWDFSIQTDHPIEANRPDIVVLEKTSRKCLLIDIACPFDTRVANKEKEKIEKIPGLKKRAAEDLEVLRC